jgi:hypothetical protein
MHVRTAPRSSKEPILIMQERNSHIPAARDPRAWPSVLARYRGPSCVRSIVEPAESKTAIESAAQQRAAYVG